MGLHRLSRRALALLLATVSVVLAQSDAPLAIVDGEPIVEDQLGVRGELLQLEQQSYEIRSRALEELIGERLIAAEAKRRGVSTKELLAKEVEAKSEKPSDLQVEAFYDRQKDRIRKPLLEVRGQIEDFLIEASRREARSALVKQIRAKSDVRVLIDPPRLPIDLSKAPMQGGEKAAVTIVEYSDFQCPYCKRIQPTLSQLQEKYGDKIRWSFKDLPLVSIHPAARKAAEAARCAGEQGKFWEYRKALFDAPGITSEMHPETAAKVGLDATPFEKCLTSGKFGKAVDADAKEASDLGINGTPAFVINGILLAGAQPLEAFMAVIDAELERAAR